MSGVHSAVLCDFQKMTCRDKSGGQRIYGLREDCEDCRSLVSVRKSNMFYVKIQGSNHCYAVWNTPSTVCYWTFLLLIWNNLSALIYWNFQRLQILYIFSWIHSFTSSMMTSIIVSTDSSPFVDLKPAKTKIRPVKLGCFCCFTTTNTTTTDAATITKRLSSDESTQTKCWWQIIYSVLLTAVTFQEYSAATDFTGS